MDPLIEAALLDQERRVLAATPAEIDCRRFTGHKRPGPKARAAKVYCRGGCARAEYLSQVGPDYMCGPCRRERRKQEERVPHRTRVRAQAVSDERPICARCGRRLRQTAAKTFWYCTNNHAKG